MGNERPARGDREWFQQTDKADQRHIEGVDCRQSMRRVPDCDMMLVYNSGGKWRAESDITVCGCEL